MQQELSRRKWQIALRAAARARRTEVFLRHTRIVFVLVEKTSKQFFGFINAMHVPIRPPSKTLGEAHRRVAISLRVREVRENLPWIPGESNSARRRPAVWPSRPATH